MPRFNSFVYDVAATYTPNVIRGDCYACFRLSPDYKEEGPPFGFDWVRTGDATEYVAHDIPYEGNVGRNFKGQYTLPTNKDDFIVNLRKDDRMFDALCGSYTPGSITLFPSATGNIKKYHTPVLTIYPGNTAEPAKLVLEMNITKAPNRVYLRYNEDVLEITGGDSLPSEPGKHTRELQIVCKKELNKDMYIYVLADDKKKTENLIGLMRVWKNELSHRRGIKILLLNVKFMESDAPDAQAFTGEPEVIKKSILHYLPHAFIKPAFTEMDYDMGFEPDFVRRLVRYNGLTSIVAYDEAEGTAAADPLVSFDEYFQNYLKRALKKSPKYDAFVISLGVTLCVTGSDGGFGEVEGYNGGRYAFLGPCRFFNAPAHEVLHVLGLSHTFNNVHLDETPTAFTYRAQITDNIMDYSHMVGVKLLNWWEWQWKKARERAIPESWL